MREGWLVDGDDRWIWRFHRDGNSWAQDPMVFLDLGRRMPDGPPLLKERRHIRKQEAKEMWTTLQKQGWKRLQEPAWGVAAAP